MWETRTGKKIKIHLYMAIQSGPKVVLVLVKQFFPERIFQDADQC